jgi:S1-C subfamily serine protease
MCLGSIKMKLIKLLISVVIIICVGCTYAEVRRYPGNQFGPTDPNALEIFQHEPPVAYEKIGEVSASGAPAANWNAVYEKFRIKASEIGGHAIINTRTDERFSHFDQYGIAHYRKYVSGIVIRYKEKPKISELDTASLPNILFYRKNETIDKASNKIEVLVKAVFTIKTKDGQGSSFIINSKGYAVTCYHVVEGVSVFDAVFSDGKTIKCNVIT